MLLAIVAPLVVPLLVKGSTVSGGGGFMNGGKFEAMVGLVIEKNNNHIIFIDGKRFFRTIIPTDDANDVVILFWGIK